MEDTAELLHSKGVPHLFHLLVAEAVARADAAGPWPGRLFVVKKKPRKWELNIGNTWKTHGKLTETDGQHMENIWKTDGTHMV